MDKVILLSKDNCPKCVSLKKFLDLALKNKYENIIEIVHREENLTKFNELVSKYNIMATPVLIFNDEVLFDTVPLKVTEFLEIAANKLSV